MPAAATSRTISDDRSFFGHPKGLGLLFVAEMWERFSYYGMRALVVLYLTHELSWADADAYRLYGTYTSLVWLTPMIGGYLADRFLGTHRSLVIGGVIIAAGHFTLAIPSMTAFYAGLGLVIVGTGFFKPNASTMVGQLYAEGDPRRDAGFTIFYMGINLGGFFAPLVCAYLGERVGWHYGFAAAGVGMVLGLLVYVSARGKYLPNVGEAPPRRSAATVAADRIAMDDAARPWHGFAGAGAGFVIAWVSGGSLVSILTGMVIGAALAIALLSSRGEELKRVIALCIVVFFVVFFWLAFEQAGSTMNIFADRHTDRMVGSFEIPAGWFQSIQPITVILFAPLMAGLWQALAARGREPSTSMKMVWALGLMGASFVLMVFAGRGADTGIKVSALWLTCVYSIQSVGELAISPVGLSYVTKVAPARLATLLMGVWFLSNSAANKAAGFLAEQSASLKSLGTFFTIPVATSFGAMLLMLALTPMLRRLTASVKA